MFSQTTEYALRAVVTLAGAEGQPLTTAEIAARTKVPPGYLSKVLQTLGRAGLITAARGLRGGYRLSRPAADICMLEVVNAVEPLARIRECPLGRPDHTSLCPLHRRIDEAVAATERQLASTTLEELIDPVPGHPEVPLWPVPEQPTS
ncbi:Rrf2 family transcriptional regulator [Deinococcus sp. NW-56]|uniref:RrF2 family transcriptional regulator n=1 Tax=Deinococcus sp. NW-56 TaxID=2080419 RepID=UPI0018F87F8A|nr:Rrf2 family transcriptional regulator [Deinococcus sp. NW-56]